MSTIQSNYREITCMLCPSTFKSQADLEKHLLKAPHNKERLVCPLCMNGNVREFGTVDVWLDHIKATHKREYYYEQPSTFSVETAFFCAKNAERFYNSHKVDDPNSYAAKDMKAVVLKWCKTRGLDENPWLDRWEIASRRPFMQNSKRPAEAFPYQNNQYKRRKSNGKDYSAPRNIPSATRSSSAFQQNNALISALKPSVPIKPNQYERPPMPTNPTQAMAQSLLKTGVMPFFPPAQRDLNSLQSPIELPLHDSCSKWPPTDWQNNTKEVNLMMYRSVALLLTTLEGNIINEEDTLLRWHFLIPPGTKLPKFTDIGSEMRYSIYKTVCSIARGEYQADAPDIIKGFAELAGNNMQAPIRDEILKTLENVPILI